MAAIELRGLDMRYPGGAHAVQSLDLTVDDGELFVLLGPSGCGKSTILRLLAGLEHATAGEIHLGGARVDHLPARDRDVAMVFQNYALYPHKSVRENLAFPLRMRRVPPDERSRRVEEIAELLGLGGLLHQKPATLSGGQQQRVAMGRALVRHPAAFLMDEPLSNLDVRLRTRLRGDIARLQRTLGVTTLYVTHDQVEAMTLGDRVAVLRDGRLQQVGKPQQLYDSPANVFVAAFLGQPDINLFRGTLERNEQGYAIALSGLSLPVPHDLSDRAPRLPSLAGEAVIVGIRPEALRLAGAVSSQAAPATVVDVEALGNEFVVRVETQLFLADMALPDASGGEAVAVRVPAHGPRPERGDRVYLDLSSARFNLFDQAGTSVIPSPPSPVPARET